MNPIELAEHAELFLWPVISLLLGIYAARRLGSDLRPVFMGFIRGMSDQAQRYSYFFAYGILLATAASDQELAKIADQFGWKACAAIAEVLQPGLVAFLAFLPKPLPPPDLSKVAPAGGTLPPFPPPVVGA